jgi:glyoxylase-like metal-dependent hydrolase (beta-lactamase superfamily II)
VTAKAANLTLHGGEPRFERGFQRVGDDTWAWLQPNGGLGESNSGLVASGEHVLLIDTLWDLDLTRRMLDEAGALVDAPPEIVVNTHSDGDHVWGNQLLAGARIVSSAAAMRLMTLDTPQDMRRLQRGGGLLAAIGSLPIPLIGTLDIGGLPRLPLRSFGRELAPFDWSEVELTLPTETFEGELDLTVGERRVQLIEVGPAHTGGDAVVWVPDVSVCFAADILFIDGTPIAWAGPVANWLAALDRISSLGATTYVPGHGPVCGQAEVDLLRDYFEWVQREGVSQLESGVPATKAARRMLLSDEFESLPWAEWGEPERLVITLSTEAFRREGGEGHLAGGGRTRAILHMQLTKTELERHRGRAR